MAGQRLSSKAQSRPKAVFELRPAAFPESGEFATCLFATKPRAATRTAGLEPPQIVEPAPAAQSGGVAIPSKQPNVTVDVGPHGRINVGRGWLSACAIHAGEAGQVQ